MKVKTQHVPEDCDYLTNGKEYQVIRHIEGAEDFKIIVTDHNEDAIIILSGCSHLDGHPWEVIPEEES